MCIFILGCAESRAAPTFEPVPTPTAPPAYLTFSDEQAGFQISYPDSWIVDNRDLDVIDAEIFDLLRVSDDYDLESVKTIFYASNTLINNFSPEVNVVVESLPRGTSLEQYETAAREFSDEFIPDTRYISQGRILIDGLTASVKVTENDSGDFGGLPGERYRSTQIFVVEGRVAWIITCNLIDDFSPDSIATCDAVTRSFRFSN
jgi:hypothetical protein